LALCNGIVDKLNRKDEESIISFWLNAASIQEKWPQIFAETSNDDDSGAFLVPLSVLAVRMDMQEDYPMSKPTSYNYEIISHVRNTNPEMDALLRLLEEQDHKNSRQAWIGNLIFLILGWFLGQISLTAIVAHCPSLPFLR